MGLCYCFLWRRARRAPIIRRRQYSFSGKFASVIPAKGAPGAQTTPDPPRPSTPHQAIPAKPIFPAAPVRLWRARPPQPDLFAELHLAETAAIRAFADAPRIACAAA